MSSFLMRKAVPADEHSLWEMLYYAASMEEAAGFSLATAVAQAQTNPDLYSYVGGWGRPGDVGMVATKNGPDRSRIIGAAWVRLSDGTLTGFGHATDTVPELAIGIDPAFRGQGIGTALLTELKTAVDGQFEQIILTVREHNPAKRLYERMGFAVVGEVVNRVGTKSFAMVWDL
ncbi:MAG: GNAT family N-acetyltransferase [Anaerolineales bacterium]|nr:GNAT family N-acetyltransferase [Anaerolineales bacterium]